MDHNRVRASRAAGPRIWKISGVALAVGAAFAGGSAAYALSFTPGGICTDAGFEKGNSFRETCVSRVLKERRSRAWREQAPFALLGAVAGVAANGGSAAGFVSIPGQPGLRRVDLEGQTFLVNVIDGTQTTVMSTERFKNIPKGEIDLWVRAAGVGSACPVTQRVRDFDALYVWTSCAAPVAPAAPRGATAAEPETVAASGSLADELTRLSTMRERGILSAEEFQAAKAKLLAK